MTEQPWDIQRDTVYVQMYEEMRRIRDYELGFAKWSLASLLAVAGGYLALASQDIQLNPEARLLVRLVLTLLAAGGVLVAEYANKRYDEMRTYMNNKEPAWKGFVPKKRWLLNPTRIIQLVLFLLWLMTVILVGLTPAVSPTGGFALP